MSDTGRVHKLAEIAAMWLQDEISDSRAMVQMCNVLPSELVERELSRRTAARLQGPSHD